MQFLILATDGTDPEAGARRARARPDHVAAIAGLVAAGSFRFGGHTLDDDERVVGSAMVVEFPSRAELDAWLALEPYVVQGVWREWRAVRINLG